MPIIETLMLIGGLILFSGTVTYDLNKQLVEAKNANTVCMERMNVSAEQIDKPSK